MRAGVVAEGVSIATNLMERINRDGKLTTSHSGGG